MCVGVSVQCVHVENGSDERERGREREIGDGMGDDRLDLITGWNGWEGLWYTAFSIVHSCVRAEAGSATTGRFLPEG